MCWKTKTGKIKSFFPGKKSKMKKSQTFSYNLPYESYDKKSSYEVEIILGVSYLLIAFI